MTDNFIEQYKKEDSMSSVSGDEEPRAVKVKEPEQSSAAIAPYTFNPKEVLKKYENPGHTKTASKHEFKTIGALNYNLKGTSYSPSHNYETIKSYQHREPLTSRPSYVSVFNEDPLEFRRSTEYKEYGKEFDKRFNNDQKEVEQVTRDLNAKTNKIDNFIQELRGANLDMILYKNRLARELEDVKNDLREAYNNILVLMSDRSSMKDQFSIYKVKLKKLKGFLNTYQEDAQA
jgi:hypothetical protein